jgi:hypothetical protein
MEKSAPKKRKSWTSIGKAIQQATMTYSFFTKLFPLSDNNFSRTPCNGQTGLMVRAV